MDQDSIQNFKKGLVQMIIILDSGPQAKQLKALARDYITIITTPKKKR